MLNVTFYNEINETDVPSKSGECYLETLKDGSSLFYNNSNIDTFDSDLSSLKKGSDMFYNCTNLIQFNSNLNSLVEGEWMFWGCSIENFNINMKSLVNGDNMFSECSNLKKFESDLSSLKIGDNMFYRCENLELFSADLSSLTNGYFMFGANLIKNFTNNLKSLVNGGSMFEPASRDSVSSLVTFNADLNSLVYGEYMFCGCKNLTSVITSLSSLVNGEQMFQDCKLNPFSVMYIVESIRNLTEEKEKYNNNELEYVTATLKQDRTYDYSNKFGFTENGDYVYTYDTTSEKSFTYMIDKASVGQLTLGIDVSSSTVDGKTTETQLLEFANKVGYNSWEDLKQAFVDKGWTVTFQYGNTRTDITLSEDEQFRGIPIYAKAIEIQPEGERILEDGSIERFYTESQKEKAEYCTEDGTKYYNIKWGHDVTDYSQYEYFGSLLEACGYFGVIPKEYLEV